MSFSVCTLSLVSDIWFLSIICLLLYGLLNNVGLSFLDELDDLLCPVKTLHEQPECLVQLLWGWLCSGSTCLNFLVFNLQQIVCFLHISEFSLDIIETLFRLHTCGFLTCIFEFLFVLGLQITYILEFWSLHLLKLLMLSLEVRSQLCRHCLELRLLAIELVSFSLNYLLLLGDFVSCSFNLLLLLLNLCDSV